jgi:hypothetical protein
MSNWLSGILSFGRSRLVAPLSLYNKLFDPQPRFNDYFGDKNKLTAALTSPALLKVISLQCDLFSLGQIYVYNKKGKQLDNDPFLEMIEKPNPFQTQSQFLWDFMFWNMLGNAYAYIDSKVVKSGNKMYWLVPDKIEFPLSFEKEMDKIVENLFNDFFNNFTILY